MHVLSGLFDDSVMAACQERAIGLHIARSAAQAYGVVSGYQQPVSYTHLDVYKRQVLDGVPEKGCRVFGLSLIHI